MLAAYGLVAQMLLSAIGGAAHAADIATDPLAAAEWCGPGGASRPGNRSDTDPAKSDHDLCAMACATGMQGHALAPAVSPATPAYDPPSGTAMAPPDDAAPGQTDAERSRARGPPDVV